MTEIIITAKCLITVWRKSGPSFMTSISNEEPFEMEFDDDVKWIVIT
jgi:hypothetical protein